jgi:hypothetical protein
LEKDGYKFDLKTQRFLKNRWETEIGRLVREQVINGLKNSTEVRAILDPYVLKHDENVDPYGYPIYPDDAINSDVFWVLTQDDLRGIHFYNEDFSDSKSFVKKSLTYSGFYNCVMRNVNLEQTDLSYAKFEKCNLNSVVLAYSGGFCVSIIDCSGRNICFWNCGLRDCNFSGSDFLGAYFESAVLEDIQVNYLSKFDVQLNTKWNTRNMPAEQAPDILRSLRLAYERAELWSQMDQFLLEEKRAQRKNLLWPRFQTEQTWAAFSAWFNSLISESISGYSTKPARVLLLALGLALAFSALYVFFGTPNSYVSTIEKVQEAVYFSLTTFATLGFGDVTYGIGHPILRLISSVEAWLGAIFISLFVVVLSRKVFR